MPRYEQPGDLHGGGRRISRADFGPDPTGLPLQADPASGAIVGTFLLAAWLAGPIGLALAAIAWVLGRRTEGTRPSSQSESTGDEYEARFKELENDILRDQ